MTVWLILALSSPAWSQEASFFVRAWYPDMQAVRDLARWKDVNWDEPFGDYVILEVTQDEWDRLERLGFYLEPDHERNAQKFAPRTKGDAGIPGFPCYLTVEETMAFGQTMATTYPNLAEWIDIGDSWEKINSGMGYDLMVLRLTNETIPGPKPSMFAMSGLHAREYAPVGLATAFAQWLIDGYGLDADATWLLDYHEIHLLLQANPDGRTRAEQGLSWRKNADNDFCSDSNSRGVDLNRNFEFQWACCNQSSTSECSTTFHGPGPASEPETQAVRDYIRSIFPDQRGPGLLDSAPADATGVYLDLHSFSEFVLWSWGYDFGLPVAPNGNQLEVLGSRMAFYNGYFPTEASALPGDGASDDNAYGDLGVAAYTIELGTTFFQSCTDFNSMILPDNLPALIYAAKVARSPYLTPAGPSVFDLEVTCAFGGVEVMATLDDSPIQGSPITPTVQNIAAAWLYVDLPPWDPSASGFAFDAVDGTFDAAQESGTVALNEFEIDSGPHILFVQAQDQDGNLGPVSAVFTEVQSALTTLLSGWPNESSVLEIIAATCN